MNETSRPSGIPSRRSPGKQVVPNRCGHINGNGDNGDRLCDPATPASADARKSGATSTSRQLPESHADANEVRDGLPGLPEEERACSFAVVGAAGVFHTARFPVGEIVGDFGRDVPSLPCIRITPTSPANTGVERVKKAATKALRQNAFRRMDTMVPFAFFHAARHFRRLGSKRGAARRAACRLRMTPRLSDDF